VEVARWPCAPLGLSLASYLLADPPYSCIARGLGLFPLAAESLGNTEGTCTKTGPRVPKMPGGTSALEPTFLAFCAASCVVSVVACLGGSPPAAPAPTHACKLASAHRKRTEASPVDTPAAECPERDQQIRLLEEAQGLVEVVRSLAALFQRACQQLKVQSRAQMHDSAGVRGDTGRLGAAVKDFSAALRNRDSCLRILKGLRALMDALLGSGEQIEDSWSDEDSDEDDSIGHVAKAAAKLRTFEREASLLHLRAQRLSSLLPSCAGQDSLATTSDATFQTVDSRAQLLQDEQRALSVAIDTPPALGDSAALAKLDAVVGRLRGRPQLP
jgi:hypothetical protein